MKHKNAKDPRETPATMNRFESGGDLSSIEDRNEYEKHRGALPADQKELAQESTRLADLCQYFSIEKMDIPPQVLGRVTDLRTLTIPERIRALKEINKELM